jgi:hypothetical protein
VAPFILSLLFILAVALAVVAAFALPHLRAGSPLLTPKGEQVAREARGRLRRVGDALPDRVTDRLSSTLTALRIRIAGRSASARTSPSGHASAGSADQAASAAADDPSPVAGAGTVRIEPRRIAAPRPADSAPTAIAGS